MLLEDIVFPLTSTYSNIQDVGIDSVISQFTVALLAYGADDDSIQNFLQAIGLGVDPFAFDCNEYKDFNSLLTELKSATALVDKYGADVQNWFEERGITQDDLGPDVDGIEIYSNLKNDEMKAIQRKLSIEECLTTFASGEEPAGEEPAGEEPKGKGNISDLPDSDGDGTPDVFDAFPLDPSEDTDTDGDGIGDNVDEPADEEPSDEVVEEPADEEPSDEVVEEPADEEPSDEVVEEPVGEELVGEELVGEELVGEELVGEEPVGEEPVLEIQHFVSKDKGSYTVKYTNSLGEESSWDTEVSPDGLLTFKGGHNLRLNQAKPGNFEFGHYFWNDYGIAEWIEVEGFKDDSKTNFHINIGKAIERYEITFVPKGV
jgi:hypothetical protein